MTDKNYIFAQVIERYWHGPKPVSEFQFLQKKYAEALGMNPRLWRFDFSWPWNWPLVSTRKPFALAVEIEGGVYTQGRHTRGKGFEADCEKYNTAQALGWSVLRYTPQMIQRQPLCVLSECSRAMALSSGTEYWVCDDCGLPNSNNRTCCQACDSPVTP